LYCLQNINSIAVHRPPLAGIVHQYIKLPIETRNILVTYPDGWVIYKLTKIKTH